VRLSRWRIRREEVREDYIRGGCDREAMALRSACYHCRMFNFGKPKTAADWIVHIVGAIIAIFLVWWMLRMYVL
jgi:hypothetical protein